MDNFLNVSSSKDITRLFKGPVAHTIFSLDYCDLTNRILYALVDNERMTMSFLQLPINFLLGKICAVMLRKYEWV